MSNPMRRFIDKMNSLDKAVWVWCGDSITHGAHFTYGLRDYVQLVEERWRHECKHTQHLFVKTAISGNKARDIIAEFDHRVKRFQPDFFTLMIGMNDCALKFGIEPDGFEADVKEIIRRVRSETPAEILMQTCCAIHPENTVERNRYPQFMDVVRQIAAESDLALIDHHAQWEKVRLNDRARFDKWLANPYHPNGMGHWIFAERILIELGMGPLKESPPPKAA